MKVWLVHHDEKIKAELGKVMPKLTWAEWKIGNDREATKAETIALQIMAHLRGYPGATASNRSIKATLNLGDIPSNTFTRAAKLVSAPGWEKHGQSFVRSGSARAYGFEAET